MTVRTMLNALLVLQLGLVLLLAATPPEDLGCTDIAELGERIVTLLELCQQKIVASEDSSSHALDPAASEYSSHTTGPAPSLDQTGREDSCSAPAPIIDPAVSEDGSSATTGPVPSLDTGSSALGMDPAAREDGSIASTSTKVAELVLRCLRHILSWSSIRPSLCGSSALINVLFQCSTEEAKSWVSFSAPISINNKYSFLSNTLFRTSVRSCQWNAF